MPSTMRLAMSTATFVVKTPMSEPKIAHMSAMAPLFLGPSLFKMIDAGSAMMMPTSENSELNQPAVAMSMPNALCSVVMQGATLF